MACTSQSALDYVKRAKRDLISGLKNLSVILENLNQKGVLGDEEVSNIKAEKTNEDKIRTTLISVTKKGEAACYELLKIIDMTRKRTLEKPLLLPEINKFDLHHWISCFSFKEETQVDTNYLQGPSSCHKYQEKLKSKAKEISNDFWAASKKWFEGNKRPDLSYTSLILDAEESVCPTKIKKFKKRKSKLSRPKKMKTYIPEEKPNISPTVLLKTDKNILLVGKPGIGKTALTHEMLRLWAERESEELDYMFYFDMRETAQIMNAKDLEELFFSFYCGPDEGKDEVLQDIQRNPDNVTIIFDGLTDLSSPVVEKLLNKDLLPLAKIIITCRPDDEDEDLFSGNFYRVEVKGFSEQTIKTYLSATLGEDQTKVLSSVALVTLCHVPMYALMMAVCFSSKDAPQPCTITEIYINIVRYCLQMNSKKKNKDLNSFIKTKTEQILSLAEAAFLATQQKTVNLTDLPCEDSCVLSFLKPLLIKVAPTETITTHAFLHYTVQEFFAALWLLKNPDKIRDVFQQCLTEEKKHMKHLIPFMCRLLNEKSPSLMKHLIPDKDLKNTSNWFFKELINTFLPHLCEQEEADTEDSGLHVDILFLCQCLYESQSPEACIYLLDKLDYHLDLSGESLDPYPCCAVAYVVTQSKERKIRLNLEDVMISEQGMRQLFGCFKNVQWSDPLVRQLWEIFLISEEQMDFVTLLSLDGNLHLPVDGEKQLYERAVEVMQRMPTKVNVCLYWDKETPACHSQCESLLKAFPFISSVSFRGPVSWSQEKYHGTLEREQKRLFMDLCLKAALHDGPNFYNVVKMLLPLFPVKTDLDSIFLDLFQYVKSKEFLGDFQGLRPFFQSAPAVWSINLSERKTSILLEVLKLQPEKKQVKLTDCSHEESEVRSFLQCLPYISQLSVLPDWSRLHEAVRFFGNLFCAAAEREQQTGEKILKLLSSVCTYQTFPLNERDMDAEIQCAVLLDLYSHVKDCETKTGLSVLPSLQSVFQSAPAVWFINLSERKTSILLEVLKLQPEKKQVKLTGCSYEESEVRSFLQCLPYISQLSVLQLRARLHEAVRFFVTLFCAAAEREQQTGEKILELLSSVCTYQTFPLNETYMDAEIQCDFLIYLYSQVKDYETKTGLSVLPSLQSVFQSAPAVWSINLSDRKTSILLELTGCSHEESEVRSFQQCLPYISQLRSEGAQTKELEMDMLAIQSAVGDSEVKLGPNTPDINPKDATKLPSSFIPKVQNESAQISYRFKSSGSGLFHCTLTGLVFDLTREAELLYKIIQWDESILHQAGKMAAGPLFDIKCCEDAVRQLHFPHCETQKALLSDGLLSVVHFTDDTMSFIKPLKITDTHVVIKTPHFSAFGPVVDLDSAEPVKGQILLFLRPPNCKKETQNLNVLLLPRNIPLDQVSRQHQGSHFILVPSACNLIKNQTYTVHCPVACKIQPKRAELDMGFGPNYPPTFVICFPMNTEEITLTLRDQTDAEVWEHEVDLTDHLPFSADGRISAQEIMVMLLDILKDLSDDVFSDFKWHLKIKEWNDMPPIKESDLFEAKRTTTVDLMVQKYQITGAVQVMEIILKTISRNDLVEKLLTLRH
uniref:NACHT domain-containing protein n=1 Tax=Oreochromis aureus TaxID=47969 RepID=A0AAZ1X7H3_OREAU